MAIKSLVLQLKLMTLVMVYVEICARENVPVYCNKATSVDLQNDTVTEVKLCITCQNLKQSRIQSLSSHKNESHHTLTPVSLQTINTSE